MKEVQNKGFTIIELIFVVVILAIIIAIAVAVYPGLTQSMKVRTDRASAGNIANAVRSWYVDWNTDSQLKEELEGVISKDTGYGLFEKTVKLSDIEELENYVDITGNRPSSLLNESNVPEGQQTFYIGLIDMGMDVRVVISVGRAGTELDDGIELLDTYKDMKSEEIAQYDGNGKGIIYVEPKSK